MITIRIHVVQASSADTEHKKKDEKEWVLKFQNKDNR